MKRFNFAVLSAVMFLGFAHTSFGEDLSAKDIMTKNFFKSVPKLLHKEARKTGWD